MNIKDFVSETLSQICQGIVDAQAKVEGTGACISPRMANEKPQNNISGEHTHINNVEFDIVVEVTESKDITNGGISTSINIFQAVDISLGDKKKKDEMSLEKNVSRIKFDIPVCWPRHQFVDKTKKINESKEKYMSDLGKKLQDSYGFVPDGIFTSNSINEG